MAWCLIEEYVFMARCLVKHRNNFTFRGWWQWLCRTFWACVLIARQPQKWRTLNKRNMCHYNGTQSLEDGGVEPPPETSVNARSAQHVSCIFGYYVTSEQCVIKTRIRVSYPSQPPHAASCIAWCLPAPSTPMAASLNSRQFVNTAWSPICQRSSIMATNPRPFWGVRVCLYGLIYIYTHTHTHTHTHTFRSCPYSAPDNGTRRVQRNIDPHEYRAL
jgi:hypothetical protein